MHGSVVSTRAQDQQKQGQDLTEKLDRALAIVEATITNLEDTYTIDAFPLNYL